MAKERPKTRRGDIDLDSYEKHWFTKKEVVYNTDAANATTFLKIRNRSKYVDINFAARVCLLT